VPPLLGGLIMLGISLGPSMDGGSGTAGFGEFLPYSLLMEHVEIARGCMRPIRYGVAAIMLFSINLPLVLTSFSDRFVGFKSMYRILAGTLMVLALIIQVRPSAQNASLSWPPFPEEPRIEGSGLETGEVWLDLPVIGRGENRFAQWAFNPAPRMNPPHDLGRWRDKVARSNYFLLKSLMAIERGETPDERWIRSLERGSIGVERLSRVTIHRRATSRAIEEDWVELIILSGGERIVANQRLLVYQF
jgi:hypothetical protein